MKDLLILLILAFGLLGCSTDRYEKQKSNRPYNKEVLESISTNQNIENDLTKMNLKGKVKFLSEEQSAEGGKRTSNYLFDDKGNIDENTVYDIDGSIWAKFIYSYTNTGKIKAYLVYDSNDSLVEKGFRRVFKYDSTGNEVEQLWFDKGEVVGTRIHSNYDPRGNKIEVITINLAKGQNFDKFKYDYDDENELIQSSCYHGDEQGEYLNFTNKYENDSTGRMVSDSFYDSEGNFEYKTEFSYDNKGNLSQVRSFSKDGSLTQTIDYRYTFDENENWITAEIFLNGSKTDLLKREIKYE